MKKLAKINKNKTELNNKSVKQRGADIAGVAESKENLKYIYFQIFP